MSRIANVDRSIDRLIASSNATMTKHTEIQRDAGELHGCFNAIALSRVLPDDLVSLARDIKYSIVDNAFDATWNQASVESGLINFLHAVAKDRGDLHIIAESARDAQLQRTQRVITRLIAQQKALINSLQQWHEFVDSRVSGDTLKYLLDSVDDDVDRFELQQLAELIDEAYDLIVILLPALRLTSSTQLPTIIMHVRDVLTQLQHNDDEIPG